MNTKIKYVLFLLGALGSFSVHAMRSFDVARGLSGEALPIEKSYQYGQFGWYGYGSGLSQDAKAKKSEFCLRYPLFVDCVYNGADINILSLRTLLQDKNYVILDLVLSCCGNLGNLKIVGKKDAAIDATQDLLKSCLSEEVMNILVWHGVLSLDLIAAAYNFHLKRYEKSAVKSVLQPLVKSFLLTVQRSTEVLGGAAEQE